MNDGPEIRNVPESAYRADFELLDRYQSFSAEILRLSLAGLAAIGFLLSLDSKAIGQAKIASLLVDPIPRYFLFVATAMFVAASAAALAHRGFSSESMHYQLKIASGLAEPRGREKRRFFFHASSWTISMAPVLLAAAVLAFGGGLAIVLT
jgi:hypothetical protein